jgi:predicted phosphodiesterase
VRAAIVSDIHANLQALEAVLDEIDASSCDALWCLGDLVGYGADPNACVALLRERSTICLAGNHDLAVTGAISLEDFSPGARAAAEWTRSVIDAGALAFLEALEPFDEDQSVALYHASPRDPIWEYVVSSFQAMLCLDAQPRRVGVVGHSHIALSFCRRDGGTVLGEKRDAGDVLDIRHGEWLLNPGSIGQPRDGDPRAAWLELDLERWTATFHRTDYDINAAAAAITAAGLPDSLAQRLHVGQ